MSEFKGIDVSKLKYKKEWLEAGRITIRIDRLNRHHPVSRDVLLTAIQNGHHHDKINSLFTPDSIKKAMKGKTQKSEKENES